MERIKLRHLSEFDKTDEPIDIAMLMVDIFNYKNSLLFKARNFARCFKKTYALFDEVKGVDVSKVELNPNIPIKYPKNIDTISFKAMMSLQGAFSNTDVSTVDFVKNVICTACYESNYKEVFGSDDLNKRTFENIILNSPYLDMCGLFNHIKAQYEKSNEFWSKEFMKVEVEDNDYVLAGGAELSKFNIIRTVKNTCLDFNVTDDIAWEKSYALTQTNSLEKAYASFIQHNMSKIKEDRMKSSRGR